MKIVIYRQACMPDSKDRWGWPITNVPPLFMAMLAELLLWSPTNY